ncbi:DUF4843 domain-containing protein [Butyricimonas faecihominis]|uniref:DUF4843 domain-containing protein n=1 Tax=Butyricimonas faecihominis TaxID=1472416 RepID=UPI0032BF7E2E
MKKKIYYAAAFLLATGWIGCQKAEYELFNDVARVQMGGNDEISVDFFYIDKSIKRDTAYLTVNTIGDPENKFRKIAFKQISEYDIEYTYDNKGNLIDSVVTEKPNKAIPGIHYIPMDDPEMESLLVIAPNMVTAQIPIILLRDTSLEREEFRLCLQLEETSDFLLGESKQLSRTILFADKLIKPNKWDQYEDIFWGTYSTRKHAFMTEVIGQKINDEWFLNIRKDYAEKNFWKGKCKEALQEYNSDPENIASGLAPMREDPKNPSSKLVTFP